MKLIITLLFFLLPFGLFAKADIKLLDKFHSLDIHKADSAYFFSMADSVIEQLKDKPDPNIYMSVIGDKGTYMYTRRHFPQAISYFQQALNVEGYDDFFKASYFALTLAEIYLSTLDDIPKSLYYLRIARKMFLRDKDLTIKDHRLRQKFIQVTELRIYRILGLYGLALDKLIVMLKNKQPYLFDLFSVADLYHVLNDLDNALIAYNKVLKDMGKKFEVNLRLRAHIVNRMGDIYFDKEEYGKALRYYKRSGEYARDINFVKYVWAAHLDRAYTFAHMGQADSADRELKALSRVHYNPPAKRVGHLYAVKAMVYNIKGQLDSAVVFARKGLNVLELQRKKIKISDVRQSVFKKNKVNFDQMKYALFEKYIKQKNPSLIDSLYKYSILSRGRMYGEKSRPDTSSESYREYLEASKDLEAFQLRQQLSPEPFGDSLKEMLSVKRFRLVEARISMINKKNATRYRPLLSLAELKSKMKRRNAALVIYDLNPYRPFVVFVGPEKVALIPLSFKVNSLKDSLAVYVDQLFNDDGINNSIFNTGISSYLYDQLWRPVVARVTMPADVMIVPDLDMAVLPFETLLQKKMPRKSYSVQDPASYWDTLLLQKHNFSYLPGVYSLNDTLKYREPKALILGDPYIKHSEEGWGLPSWNSEPLFYARSEAQAVMELIPGSKLLLGKNATETAFLENAAEYSIWHFATHARYDADYYNMSYIALSADSLHQKDGLLTAYEIQNMRRASRLVTISACNSGVGPVLEGEGTLSLARFFMINDAENVIVTQWTVSDAFSARLMKAFYRLLIQEKVPSLARAFKLARIEAVEKGDHEALNYKHPVYWAAFHLYGDTPNIFIPEKSSLKWVLVTIFIFLFAGVLALRRFRL